MRLASRSRAALFTAICAALVMPSGRAQTAPHPPQTAGTGSHSMRLVPPALAEAKRLMRAGQFAQAETILRQALAATPRDPDLVYTLAYCLLRQNKPAPALQQYTAAASLRVPTSQELVEVGQAYVLLNDEADADKWTLDAVRLDPANAQAWYSLGRIRYTDQKFANAAACFKKVLELTPRNVKAENNLGLALEGQNRTEEAVTAYRQAIAWQNAGPASEASEQPLLNLAIILLHRGETTEPEQLLKQAVAIAPNDPRIHEQIGHLYLRESKFDLAAHEFHAAITFDPNNSSLHFLLGQALRRLGKTAEAQVEFTAAAHLASPSATAHSQ